MIRIFRKEQRLRLSAKSGAIGYDRKDKTLQIVVWRQRLSQSLRYSDHLALPVCSFRVTDSSTTRNSVYPSLSNPVRWSGPRATRVGTERVISHFIRLW